MSEEEIYLQELKTITCSFYNLVSRLKKRGYKGAAYFLDVAFLAYNQDVDRELKQVKAI